MTTLDGWLPAHVGFDPPRRHLDRRVVGDAAGGPARGDDGALFHDGLGGSSRALEALAWYPDDVWLWLLACQWRRIDQQEPFVGRTAEVGDELGSR